MKRRLERLKERKFDLVVIGAGMHGATISAIASASGLTTALLDQGDFCGATSANSLKIVHGGLRYLQHMDIPRIRDSVISRRWMLANFPGLVKPLPCIMPTSGSGVRGRLAMALGLAANEVFSCTRNFGVPKANHLQRGRVVSRERTAEIIKGIDHDLISGGAIWYDALAMNTERIVLELVHALVANGGEAANYVQVREIVPGGDGLMLQCLDQDDGQAGAVRAAYVVNTTGPWFEQFVDPPDRRDAANRQGWSKAVNLVVRQNLFADHAVGLQGGSEFIDKDAVIQKGKRLFFFVPWRGRTMIGTIYTPHESPQVKPLVTGEELGLMLREINQIYPSARLTSSDICNYHVGLVPSKHMENSGPFDVRLDKKELIMSHEQSGLGNMISVKTVKYTTAFTVAREVMKALGKKGLFGKKQTSVDHLNLMTRQEMSGKLPLHLHYRYGRQLDRVLVYLDRDDLTLIKGNDTVIAPGEVTYGVQEEMARHLDDVLFRRTGIATLGNVPDRLIEMTADVMAKALGWSEQQRVMEIERVHSHFKPLTEINAN